MPARTLRSTQRLAIAALLTYAAFFVVSQSFYTADDPKLVAVLSWAHYGSVLPRTSLWYASILEVASLIIGLVGLAPASPN
jgi:hypothetical protein